MKTPTYLAHVFWGASNNQRHEGALWLLDDTGTLMSAVAELTNPAGQVTAPTWIVRASALDGAQKFKLALGVVLVLMVGLAGLFMGRQTDFRVLYANLADKDGGAIIAQLSQMNIPYKHADGGSAILVPAERVNDIRMRLASQGLPKGTVGGFDSMEANRFGMTQFQERLTFQRGLEGELTRSIQALSSVQNARVHLALPNQNGFFREQQKASASVLLSLHPGRVLDRAQIAGIVHLVASSVPEMSPTAVSVLDDTGKLLSNAPDGGPGAVDAQQLQYVQQVEQAYSRRIMDILEPVVGRGNVRAQVTADVDFSQSESTSESHKPNQTPDEAAIRSQQVVESRGADSAPATGVPGAVSNQPPATPSASINGATPTLTAGGANGGLGPNGKKEMITNYEVDKTVRVVRGATAVVRRVTAAVVINNTSSEVQGKTVSKPLSKEQMDQMNALVRESIGFNKDRGDSINLVNAAFAVEKQVFEDVPLWKQAAVIDTARSFAWPIAGVIFAFLVMQMLIKPAIKAVNTPPPPSVEVAGGQLNAVVADDDQRPEMLALGGGGAGADASGLPVALTDHQLRIEDARALTKANPVAVANIVKTWVNGESPV